MPGPLYATCSGTFAIPSHCRTISCGYDASSFLLQTICISKTDDKYPMVRGARRYPARVSPLGHLHPKFGFSPLYFVLFLWYAMVPERAFGRRLSVLLMWLRQASAKQSSLSGQLR